MKNRFNLLHEKWIPVDNHGLVSLSDIFSRSEFRAIGGPPIQKVALFKLLQAIAQAACTPADEAEWNTLDAQTMASRCLSYLNEHKSAFYLYGENPFLQLPAVATAKPKPYGCVIPHVSNGNTTVLTQIQQVRPLDDAKKALLLVTLMSFAFAGKQCDNSLVLSTGYNGKHKGSSAPPGPALANPGLQHSMILADALLDTLHINLLTHEQIQASKMYSSGLGVAPWERMPVGEDCPAARDLKNSLMGRLVPMCRFLLLQQDHLHITEGLKHPGYQDGRADPTVSMDRSGVNLRVKWVDPGCRPWRQLSSILALFGEISNSGFQCLQLKTGLNRVRRTLPSFAVWAGGIRLKNQRGEQYVQAGNDYVESIVWLHSTALGEVMFTAVKTEMDDLEKLSHKLESRVRGYYKALSFHGKLPSRWADIAATMFWQMVERDFQALVYACEPSTDSQVERIKFRRKFANYALLAFDATCANSSARQMAAWAKYRITVKPYLT
ncbi:CRISPR system Cascade subunit CasA [Pseudomonas sp. IT-194MI4]|uniref:type I-E CRISPR-associated protein Cse1/CasA n=1 Tax=Pseudomonas sp. IT-194MI4 TaxID=3026443 RepID=UPI0039E0F562